jgi:hypothetical protein
VDDLTRELRELVDWLETPPPPDITAAVRERLTAPPPRRLAWWRRRWRRLLSGLLVAVILAALPPSRAALADAFEGLLRFAGVEFAAPAPSPAPLPPSPSALPGQRAVTLEQARGQVRFPVLLPAELGQPQQVLVADPDSAGMHRVLSLLYRDGTIRLDAFDGRFDPYFVKQVSGPGMQWLVFQGGTAIWVAAPHPLIYVDRDGATHTETARLAGSTLIWEAGDLSYRLEGDLTRDEALKIAGSLR